MSLVADQTDSSPSSPENGAWDGVRAGWRQLFGSFVKRGVSIEAHDFSTERELDWTSSFHRDSVEICLNLDGSGVMSHRSVEAQVSGAAALCYSSASGSPVARRSRGERHRFITLEFRRDFLAGQLAGQEENVAPLVKRSVFNQRAAIAVGESRPLTAVQRDTALRLLEPPVTPAALPLWYEAKVSEAIAEFLFAPAQEMFCQRQQRLAHERVERVQEILRRTLAEPPTLEAIAQEVGVSQFYLSRIFSQEMRMTIPQFLRRIRMERAAELLRDGRHNVTEAAFAVGYSSLGHFSKSFCEVLGCCPALYPQARHLATH